MEWIKNRSKYLVVAVLTLFNFTVCYYSFRAKYNLDPINPSQDRLSGQQFVAIQNEQNPFGPYFVGFSILNDRGVSNDELRYIYDVLTNFTMYNTMTYRAKISVVNDSFRRESVSGLFPKYSFKFGINDKNIHTMNISSDTVAYKTTIKISDGAGKEQFNRTFSVYSSY